MILGEIATDPKDSDWDERYRIKDDSGQTGETLTPDLIFRLSSQKESPPKIVFQTD